LVIDDEPLRRIKQAVVGRLNWLKRRSARTVKVARALWHLLPSPSVTVAHVVESDVEGRAGSKRYEKVPLSDAVALTIMQRYGIAEVFSPDRGPLEGDRASGFTRRPR
jgi:predicted nucleic acid-binding protein